MSLQFLWILLDVRSILSTLPAAEEITLLKQYCLTQGDAPWNPPQVQIVSCNRQTFQNQLLSNLKSSKSEFERSGNIGIVMQLILQFTITNNKLL